MTVQSKTMVTDRPNEARILPIYCPWYLAVTALILTAMAAVLMSI